MTGTASDAQGRTGARFTLVLRCLSVLSLAAMCAAASGSASTSTVVLSSRIQLDAIADSPPGFSYTTVSGAIADLNGDGSPDIVLGLNGTPPAVFLNNGTATPFANVAGVFVAAPPGASDPGIGYGTVVVVDVNADGHPDLAVAGFNSPNLIYLNDGTATPFRNVVGIPIGTGDVAYVPALGDVNGDGFADMAVANNNDVASRLYLTHGAPLTSGGYSTVQIGSDLGAGQDIKIADVNGDGKPDLILAYIHANVGDFAGIAIYLNNGTSEPFDGVVPLRLLAGQNVNAIAVADLNQDGKQDLVAVVSNAALTQNELYVFTNTGVATQPYGDPQPLQPDMHLGGGCLAVSVGDVNSDGLPDLIFACAAPVANTAQSTVNHAVGAIYLNNGTATPFAGVAPVGIPATYASGYGRSASVGTLVTGEPPDILLVDADPGPAGYFPTSLDQNPVAQADTAECAYNGTVQVNVLSNDSASSGQSISSTSLKIVTPPVHGTASVKDGAIVYTAAAEYSGADTLQYSVQDNLGAPSNVATVSIQVTPPPASGGGGGAVELFALLVLGGVILRRLYVARR